MACRNVVHEEEQHAAQYLLAAVNDGNNHEVWASSATTLQTDSVPSE